MNEPILRQEHDEFARRMGDEHRRISKRLSNLEEIFSQIGELTASVKTLAVNMENMLKVQEQQGKRLEKVEGRDGEMWRKAAGYAVTVLVGAVVGFALKQIGF